MGLPEKWPLKRCVHVTFVLHECEPQNNISILATDGVTVSETKTAARFLDLCCAIFGYQMLTLTTSSATAKKQGVSYAFRCSLIIIHEH